MPLLLEHDLPLDGFELLPIKLHSNDVSSDDMKWLVLIGDKGPLVSMPDLDKSSCCWWSKEDAEGEAEEEEYGTVDC